MAKSWFGIHTSENGSGKQREMFHREVCKVPLVSSWRSLRQAILAERDGKVAKLAATRAKAASFYDALPTWRNVDRLLMIGVYAFFSILVFKAWRYDRLLLLPPDDLRAATWRGRLT